VRVGSGNESRASKKKKLKQKNHKITKKCEKNRKGGGGDGPEYILKNKKREETGFLREEISISCACTKRGAGDRDD
jgi:hypothetical protein